MTCSTNWARGKTSADQQIAVYERTGDIRAVVDWLIEETMRGCRLPDGSPNII